MAMGVYVKVGGTWVEQSGQPLVKKNGVWTPVGEIWVKKNGTWKQSYDYNALPPAAPVLSLTVKETTFTVDGRTKKAQHLKVGVRYPEVTHNESVRLIRLLIGPDNGASPPANYTDPMINTSDPTWPDEPWSEFHYNGWGTSSQDKDTSVEKNKDWPPRADDETNITADKTYHFAAWTQDTQGRWSAPTRSSIYVPKLSDSGAGIKNKEARFSAKNVGSMTKDGFIAGPAIQQDSPRSQGIYLYGNQFTDNLTGNAVSGTVQITSASIFVHRKNDDGKDQANLYLFWHPYKTGGEANDAAGNLNRNEITKIGQIAKGESKWFPIPESMWGNLKGGASKGFGFAFKDPDKSAAQANDYSNLKDISAAARSGEVHVTWTETP